MSLTGLTFHAEGTKYINNRTPQPPSFARLRRLPPRNRTQHAPGPPLPGRGKGRVRVPEPTEIIHPVVRFQPDRDRDRDTACGPLGTRTVSRRLQTLMSLRLTVTKNVTVT